MKLFLDTTYNNFELKTNNNVIVIYGANDSGKTSLIDYIDSKAQSKIYNLVDDIGFDDNRTVVKLSEDFDLNNELTLKKKSKLYKVIFKDLKSLLNLNDFDIRSKIEGNPEVKSVINFLNNHLQLNSENYKIDTDFNFVSNFQFFENNLKLRILDNEDEEANIKLLSKSRSFKIYFDILKNTEYNNQIILIDCPETFLDSYNRKTLIDTIDKLKENNLIVITVRDINFLLEANNIISLYNLYQLVNHNLKRIDIDEIDLKNFFNKKIQEFGANYELDDLEREEILDVKNEYMFSKLK